MTDPWESSCDVMGPDGQHDTIGCPMVVGTLIHRADGTTWEVVSREWMEREYWGQLREFGRYEE